jgi:hypothetical protein
MPDGFTFDDVAALDAPARLIEIERWFTCCRCINALH